MIEVSNLEELYYIGGCEWTCVMCKNTICLSCMHPMHIGNCFRVISDEKTVVAPKMKHQKSSPLFSAIKKKLTKTAAGDQLEL